MARRGTLKDKIERRIRRSTRSDVFLPREFSDLGGEDQVLRALRILVGEQKLFRLGYGVYGRARRSSLNGKPVLAARNGFTGAAQQALDKLGVAWEPSAAVRAYNEGQSTQVPVKPVVRVKDRFSRKLAYGPWELGIER
jgi:hypothetical protein